MIPSPLTSLFAAGLTTGTVLESGHSVTSSVCVYDGQLMTSDSHMMPYGGLDLSRRLCDDLQSRHPKVVITLDTARDVKEKLCVVKEKDAVVDKADCRISSYELPDGTTMQLDDELLGCPEIVFHTLQENKQTRRQRNNSKTGHKHNDKTSPGTKYSGSELGNRRSHQDLVSAAINEVSSELQPQMYSSVVLSGGNTLFPGFATRLGAELVNGVQNSDNVEVKNAKVKVIDLPDRKYSAWLGASILASLANFTDMVITKDEYMEYGPSVITRKCNYYL